MGQSTVAFDVRGLSKQVALRLVAKFALKKAKLGACLDALREHKIQSSTEPEYGTYDCGHLAAALDRFDEGAIDLDLVEWKGTE